MAATQVGAVRDSSAKEPEARMTSQLHGDPLSLESFSSQEAGLHAEATREMHVHDHA